MLVSLRQVQVNKVQLIWIDLNGIVLKKMNRKNKYLLRSDVPLRSMEGLRSFKSAFGWLAKSKTKSINKLVMNVFYKSPRTSVDVTVPRKIGNSK
jgi:hypothetical protein